MKAKGEQGSGPEGVDNLCFPTYGKFSNSPPPPGIGPLGWDLDLEVEIWVSRQGSGLQARTLAFRLRFGPQG